MHASLALSLFLLNCCFNLCMCDVFFCAVTGRSMDHDTFSAIVAPFLVRSFLRAL
jgi:hypothetical protein